MYPEAPSSGRCAITWRAGASVLLGMSLSLSWTPVEWPWWQWLLVPLYSQLLWHTRHDGWRAGLGLCFGLGLHGVGQYWLWMALWRYSGWSWGWAAALGLSGLLLLSLSHALAAWWLRCGMRHHATNGRMGIGAVWWWAVLWTAAEWSRTRLLSGLTLGQAWVGHALEGWLPVVGEYGLSAAVVACSCGLWGSLSIWAPSVLRYRWRPIRWTSAGWCCSSLLLLASADVLSGIEWVRPWGMPVAFALPDLHMTLPQDSASPPESPIAPGTELVLWPESSLPLPAHEWSSRLWSEGLLPGTPTGAQHFIGLPVYAGNGQLYNSVLQWSPGQSLFRLYRKSVLMPIGEYLPAWSRRLLPQRLASWRDLTPGPAAQAPFVLQRPGTPAVLLATLVCREDHDANLWRQPLQQVHAVLNPGDFSWFDTRWLGPQAEQLARLRALQSGRPWLRSVGADARVHIDHRGQVRERQHAPGQPLQGWMQPMSGFTPYARWGDRWIIVLMIGAGWRRYQSAVSRST